MQRHFSHACAPVSVWPIRYTQTTADGSGYTHLQHVLFNHEDIMSEKKLKQVIAVITFEDNEDNIMGLSDAATWIDAKLRTGDSRETLEVTTFTTAAIAAASEAEREGDFALDAERLLGH
jgi:hypothetical protein